MKMILSLLAVAFFLHGCATGERMQTVSEGMSKEEVVSQLGEPDGYRRNGDYEALQYTNRLISGWSWDRTDYTVILENGRVVEYGPGEVRERDSGTGTLILVPVR
ncbi:hypothetical protein E0L35_24460 [Halomonas sp. ATBC28]|uniref:Outer membrane protein assembly factor BamE n=1 Tax=Vreelandella titanicae TaxID=664683 RepID=A0AAP9T0S6_9GAMM|nr:MULTISPECIES: hypothetical protein [Halomonas]QKS23811.1 hypothetical protein FX987_01578 [Halomonas titanicae]TMU14572.1 hypothetical protein E0L35_24460 [Halomonas sp. ATBC28]CDG54944.1 conserved exported hypothetical protein [Halomonas sp. A3H3]SDI63951.1 hypothetical protein SAMN04487867_110115 [Halomonas titanicae]|tara:strand:- start:1541 stop:1855 length:315 start_codon:yes stop_codon:yes gene_type:complete